MQCADFSAHTHTHFLPALAELSSSRRPCRSKVHLCGC